MRFKFTFLLLFTILSSNSINSQNYLRIVDPNNWWGINSTTPGWEETTPHGYFDEVSLVVSPQGIYTEIEVYATISDIEGYWWNENLEVIWQFDLPAQAIVHDSWLWVEDEIIKADVIDYWTALEIYEEIVDRNQDPSFLYMLPDNRYEIRIFPLPFDESRKIKMSFLIPAKWDANTVTQDLLQNMFQSTAYSPGQVSIAMPVNERWGTPTLSLGNEDLYLTETIIGGTGDLLHYTEINGEQFVNADKLEMKWGAPFYGPQKTYLSTYQENEEQFYQLAFVPEWDLIQQDEDEVEKALLLIDYKASKTTTEIAALVDVLSTHVLSHYTSNDAINIGTTTDEGVQFLSDNWWSLEEGVLEEELMVLLTAQNDSDLQLLLEEGFSWLQSQAESANHVYLFAANDEYVYPPVAEEAFYALENNIDGTIPFTIFDFQNENLSVLYYNDETYEGNGHFYDLLSSAFTSVETIIMRNETSSFSSLIEALFPTDALPTGIVDYVVTMENGICYNRYSLNSSTVSTENEGVLMQTGKYLGDFPMSIDGVLITEENELLNVSAHISADAVIASDTLLREIWYGQHLKDLFGQVASDDDRQELIELSITERILTPLTAFLALEPGLGGEPCIACLNNNGGPLINTNEAFMEEIAINISPNPSSDFAQIKLSHPEGFQAESWNAGIYDLTGKKIAQLDQPFRTDTSLEWEWTFDDTVSAGIYLCKIESVFGQITEKIIVVKK